MPRLVNRLSKYRLLLIGCIVAVIGVVISSQLFALSRVSLEAESSGQLQNAVVVSDSSASGSQALNFGQAATSCSGEPNTPGGPDPWGGCWPGPNSTGIAGCPALSTHNGDYRAGTGDVVENKLINGQLLISAAGTQNITVRCVKVVNGSYFPIDTERSGATSPSQILFDRVEVDCGGSQQTHAAFLLFGATVRKGRVLNCADAYRFSSNTVIEDSYCGDLNVTGDDANEWHYDCSQTGGGENMTIRHNSFVGKDTSDVALWPDIEPIDTVLVEKNLFIGTPGYKIYVGKPGRATTNVTVRDNRFGRGGYGPCSVENSTPAWTNNVWNDTGAAIPLSSC